jgi:hypothetical protein
MARVERDRALRLERQPAEIQEVRRGRQTAFDRSRPKASALPQIASLE